MTAEENILLLGIWLPFLFLISLIFLFFFLRKTTFKKYIYKNILFSFIACFSFVLSIFLYKTTNTAISMNEKIFSSIHLLLNCCFLTYLFFTFINLILTSLRIKLLIKLSKNNRPVFVRSLSTKLDLKNIYISRLQKLESWHQLKRKNNTIYLQKGTFYFLNNFIQKIRKILNHSPNKT